MATVLTMSAALVALILGGVWIAFAIGVSGLFGLAQILDWKALDIIGTLAWQGTTSFTLVAVPLFILMGDIFFHSGLATHLYTGIAKLIRGLPGDLIQTNIVSSTVFAACSGSSVASAASLGPMGYEEQVKKRGYNPELVLGSLAAGGTLGILIPPSVIFIIYGSQTDQSIGRLFLAGAVPGLVLSLLFMIYIAIRCLLNRSLAPATDTGKITVLERLSGFKDVWPFLVVAGVVLGTIYGGVATPTEAAAFGAASILVISLAYRAMTWKIFWKICLSTVRTTSMIYFVVIAANAMAIALGYYNVPALIKGAAQNLGPTTLLIFVVVLYLVMGMFFDAISMMLITLPFIVPLIEASGFDPIWFGVVLVVLIEAGLLTPPVGLNLFVMQGSTGADLMAVVRGSLPFVALQLLLIILLVQWPWLALWLPSKVMGG